MALYHEHNGEKYVRWAIFIWAISIIFIVLSVVSGVAMSAQAKVDQLKDSQSAIKEQLSGIQADLIWIKNNLK